jgi:hypothetical protein
MNLRSLVVTILGLSLSACSSMKPMPTEIVLKDPNNRHLEDVAGRTSQDTATICAYNMANASPARFGIRDIRYRIIGVDNPLIVEVDGLLTDIGGQLSSLEVTWRCEISGGRFIQQKWVRGLKG